MKYPTLLSFSLIAGLCAALAACGGGSPDTVDTASAQDATAQAQRVVPTKTTLTLSPVTATKTVTTLVATSNTLQVGVTIPGFPHKFDVYAPAGATKAVVFLHGRGGVNFYMAYQLGLNSKAMAPTTANINWTWLANNGIIAVFPQAMNAVGTTVATWSDYIQTSGYDDVGFLKSLSATLRTTYGATEVSLAGHSDGGAMTSRMWCESTASFKAFVSMAGPMPSQTYPKASPVCTPQTPAPYYVLIGGADTTLQAFAPGPLNVTPDQVAAGLTNNILAYEWQRFHDRAQLVCGESPVLTSYTKSAQGETWNACSNRQRYFVVTQADHPIPSLQQFVGQQLVDAIATFIKG